MKYQLVFSLFLIVLFSAAGYSQDNELLKPLDIEYCLYSNLTGQIITESLESFSLNTSTYKVKSGESIGTIIQKNGFLFDGEVLTLLYILNPDLKLGNWESVNHLVIPIVNQKSKYQENIKKQEYISIICYSKLKKEISEKIFASDIELGKIIKAQKQKNLGNSRPFEEIKESCDIIIKLITSGIKPLNQEFLENILAEIDDLASLESGYSYSELESQGKRDSIKDIKESLGLLTRAAVFKRGPVDELSQFPKVNVIVTVLDNKNSNEKLKVYYVPRARLNKKQIYYKEFDKFSPPSVNQLITTGSYWFWAGKPNDLKALTNLQKVDIPCDKEQIEIELLKTDN